MDILESAKKAAAYKVVDEYVQDKSVVGIGSGSTIVYAVQRLAERVKNENLSIVCIAMSFPVKQMISDHGLVLAELENHPKLDLTIDGANEVDEDLNLIKGGGGYLLQEKVIASCSEEFVIVADHTKITKKFGGSCKIKIPIEVIPLANVPIRMKIQSKFGGTVKLRIAPKTAKYGPVVTDNGNFLLDWDFPSDIYDWERTNTEISLIPGVVETGIFINVATKAYFGMEDGSVKEQVRITLISCLEFLAHKIERKMNTLDSAKRAAGCKAVDEIVENKSVVEIGSGATVAYAVQRLAERVTEEKLDVVCITESYTAQQLIIGSNLILGDLATYPKIMKLQ